FRLQNSFGTNASKLPPTYWAGNSQFLKLPIPSVLMMWVIFRNPSRNCMDYPLRNIKKKIIQANKHIKLLLIFQIHTSQSPIDRGFFYDVTFLPSMVT